MWHDATKPLPEAMLSYSLPIALCGVHMRAISQEVLMSLIRNMRSEITFLDLLPHLPVAN